MCRIGACLCWNHERGEHRYLEFLVDNFDWGFELPKQLGGGEIELLHVAYLRQYHATAFIGYDNVLVARSEKCAHPFMEGRDQ